MVLLRRIGTISVCIFLLLLVATGSSLLGFISILFFLILGLLTVVIGERRDERNGKKYQIDESYSSLQIRNSEERKKYRMFMTKLNSKKR